jgi:hypothetical protein
MRDNAPISDILFSFIERRQNPHLFLEILVRRILRERPECLKGFLLWRHAETMVVFSERARLRFSRFAER